MKRLLSASTAGRILLISMGLLVVFHALVMFGFAPPDIVWGGKIADSPARLRALEIAALFVTLIFAFIIAAKMDYIETHRFKKTIPAGVWILFAFLAVNTAGNLASSVSFERLIFAPITFLLAFCALRLAIER